MKLHFSRSCLFVFVKNGPFGNTSGYYSEDLCATVTKDNSGRGTDDAFKNDRGIVHGFRFLIYPVFLISITIKTSSYPGQSISPQ